MSRLFDALKEASRFRENSNGSAGESVWKALGVNDAEGQPVLGKAQESDSAAAAVLLAEIADAPLETEPAPGLPPVTNEQVGMPVKVTLDLKARLIPHTVNPAVVERYRMLRTKIMQERGKKPFRSLVVASASPREGKTVTVLNLALSFATLPSFKILVVDGDMRRGNLGDWLGIDHDRPGLSNLIDGSAQLGEVILKSEELPLDVIVRGNTQVHDLHLSQFTSHFRKMTERYDLVLVDSPPVNLITDVQLLATSCDAVLLVARAFSTTRKALEQAVQNLQSFRVIGTVLNAGTNQGSIRYQGYY